MEEFFSEKLSKNKILSFIDLMRPWNSLIYFLALFYAAAFAQEFDWSKIAISAAIIFSMYSAGAILNDIIDYKIDKKSMPYRPLTSGRISIHEAKRVMYILWSSGLVVGVMGGFWGIMLALSLLIIGISYSLWLARIPFVGPITLAYGSFFVTGVLGLIILTEQISFQFIVNLFLLTLFISALISTKDFKDAKYDAVYGKKTLATKYGTKKGMRIVRKWILSSGFLLGLFTLIINQHVISLVSLLFIILALIITWQKNYTKVYAYERILIILLFLILFVIFL